MHIHRPREFFRRFGAAGLIGFGESYMAGDWDSTDLTALLTVFAAHAAELVPPWLQHDPDRRTGPRLAPLPGRAVTALTLLAAAAALLILQGLTFLVALKVGKHSVVDTAWGIGIALAALVSFLVSLGHGDTTRRGLLLAASVLWGPAAGRLRRLAQPR
jgi:hypothetical protein